MLKGREVLIVKQLQQSDFGSPKIQTPSAVSLHMPLIAFRPITNTGRRKPPFAHDRENRFGTMSSGTAQAG
jgi:hypothetical protein